jgi:FtsH-binding integral membrane protein
MLIVAQFAQLIFISLGFEQARNMPGLTWIGIAIFTGIVAFDWARALSMPYTLDNAIDASGGLILDAVNIFIRLLQILGSSSSSSRD